ncbi:hypothetical protein PQR34_46830 [Paraburkholderia sediminicola]|uniref:hypothetical protein n=1 Tax=Paraburkholderia sediminicola TaxID=458836 RepID=UPI0038B9DB79
MATVFGDRQSFILPVDLPMPMSAPPSFQGDGYDNLITDFTNAGAITGCAYQLGPADFSTNRNITLRLALGIVVSTGGYTSRVYTKNVALDHPTWVLFEA